MKIKMLPNWGKKLGFLIFVLGFIISGYKGFLQGITGCSPNSIRFNYFENLFSDTILHLFEVLAILGMLLYMFSKEKIEDDYINKLRLESFQLTSFIGLAITIVVYAISGEIRLTLDYFIILFLWIYLGVFAIKKRTY
jgi:predicted ABC-type exoprotein transport system permease subunit